MKRSPGIALFVILPLIRIYQWLISPLLGVHCRFEPTCSRYAEEAIRTHGGVRGTVFTVKRLCRCHPFARSGVDPVPPIQTK